MDKLAKYFGEVKGQDKQRKFEAARLIGIAIKDGASPQALKHLNGCLGRYGIPGPAGLLVGALGGNRG